MTPEKLAERTEIAKALRESAVHGPAQISIANQATLHLPEGCTFIPGPVAERMARFDGNSPLPGLQGAVGVNMGPQAYAQMEIVFVPSGYVRDDDVRDASDSSLLERIRHETSEANKHRAETGMWTADVRGFARNPSYVPAEHRVSWAVWAHSDKASPADSSASTQGHVGLNYRSIILGREGYLALNLIANSVDLETITRVAESLARRISFDPGKRYADVNLQVDHVSPVGLAAVIVGAPTKR